MPQTQLTKSSKDNLSPNTVGEADDAEPSSLFSSLLLWMPGPASFYDYAYASTKAHLLLEKAWHTNPAERALTQEKMARGIVRRCEAGAGGRTRTDTED